MTLTNEQRKQLIEVFPFLLPRNVWTGEIVEDYDYSWLTGVDEIPEGWGRLFLLYCKHIRSHLVKSNMLNTFRFSQVKEKYGSLRLYDFGCPESATYLTSMFEAYSRNICQRCGNKAAIETTGWIGYFCSACVNDSFIECLPFKQEKVLTIIKYSREGAYKECYTLRHLDKEYTTIMKMPIEEFLTHILTV